MASQSETDGIKNALIEESLDAVLTSEQFNTSPQLSDFLRYVVSKKLEGQESELKAYSIAVDALGKSENFDPQTNAAVRVAAGRLRQALALYNAEPSSDPVQISLNSGSYIPEFSLSSEKREVALEPEAIETELQPEGRTRKIRVRVKPALIAAGLVLVTLFGAYSYWNRSQPVVQITDTSPVASFRKPVVAATLQLPDSSYPDWARIEELENAISVSMARFTDYEFGGVAVQRGNQEPEQQKLDYHLEVSAHRRGDEVHFFSELFRQSDGRIIWSFEQRFGEPANLSNRNVADIVGKLYAPIASPYGVIYADLATSSETQWADDCVVLAYKYFYHESIERHRKARDCAESLAPFEGGQSHLYAMLTFLYLDEYRLNRNRRNADPLKRAIATARKAIELSPQSARAQQALFGVYKVQGLEDLSRTTGQKAIALNPYDTDILGDFAAWLISTGSFLEAKEPLNAVLNLQDSRPAWLEFYRFLLAEMTGDYDQSDALVRQMSPERSGLSALAVTVASIRQGNTDKMKKAYASLALLEPDFIDDPMTGLAKRGFTAEVAIPIVEKLVEAGLVNP